MGKYPLSLTFFLSAVMVILSTPRQASGALTVNILRASGKPVLNGVLATKSSAVELVMTGRNVIPLVGVEYMTRWCSGTLVGPNVVLTAAHCLTSDEDLDSISVNINGTQWSSTQYVVNPKYNSTRDSMGRFRYDLALVMLPVSFDSESYSPIEVGVDASLIIGSDVQVTGFAGQGPKKTGTNRVIAYVEEEGILYFEGLQSDRVDSTGLQHADGTEVGVTGGDSGGSILSASGDSVLGLVSFGYSRNPPREKLITAFGETLGGQVADDLDRANSGSNPRNPKNLFFGPLVSSPENMEFLKSARDLGFGIEYMQAPRPPTPLPAPQPKSKTPPIGKSKTLDALRAGALNQQ